MTDTIFRHMVYDSVPLDQVRQIQAEAMADEASVGGKGLTDFTGSSTARPVRETYAFR